MSMSAVNLLGRVLDTPDSITSAPDNIGSLYKCVGAAPRGAGEGKHGYRPCVGGAANAPVLLSSCPPLLSSSPSTHSLSALPLLPPLPPCLPLPPRRSVYEYLEIAQRVQLLNDRFSVMQELLDILRVHVQVGCSRGRRGGVGWGGVGWGGVGQGEKQRERGGVGWPCICASHLGRVPLTLTAPPTLRMAHHLPARPHSPPCPAEKLLHAAGGGGAVAGGGVCPGGGGPAGGPRLLEASVAGLAACC